MSKQIILLAGDLPVGPVELFHNGRLVAHGHLTMNLHHNEMIIEHTTYSAIQPSGLLRRKTGLRQTLVVKQGNNARLSFSGAHIVTDVRFLMKRGIKRGPLTLSFTSAKIA